jgi:hypothetical protein
MLFLNVRKILGFVLLIIVTFSCENNNVRTKNDSQASNSNASDGNESLIPGTPSSNAPVNPVVPVSPVVPVNPVVPVSPVVPALLSPIEKYCKTLNDIGLNSNDPQNFSGCWVATSYNSAENITDNCKKSDFKMSGNFSKDIQGVCNITKDNEKKSEQSLFVINGKNIHKCSGTMLFQKDGNLSNISKMHLKVTPSPFAKEILNLDELKNKIGFVNATNRNKIIHKDFIYSRDDGKILNNLIDLKNSDPNAYKFLTTQCQEKIKSKCTVSSSTSDKKSSGEINKNLCGDLENKATSENSCPDLNKLENVETYFDHCEFPTSE